LNQEPEAHLDDQSGHNWAFTALGLVIVFGVPRLFKQSNHNKMIEAARISCQLLKDDKPLTQMEALMAGVITSGVNLKGKTNSTQESVREYGEILTKCGFKME